MTAALKLHEFLTFCVFFFQHDLKMIQRATSVSMEARTSDILCFFIIIILF